MSMSVEYLSFKPISNAEKTNGKTGSVHDINDIKLPQSLLALFS